MHPTQRQFQPMDTPQSADETVSLEEAAKKLFVDDKKDEKSSEPEDEGE